MQPEGKIVVNKKATQLSNKEKNTSDNNKNNEKTFFYLNYLT